MKKTVRFVPLRLFCFFMLFGLAARGQSITSFTPATGPVGTLVTITGSNLGNPTGFTIGGVAAIVVSNTGSTLTGMVMPGAVTGTVKVTTAGGTATGSGNFTVTPTLYPALQQGSKLVGTGTGTSGSPSQGYSVALSADGNTAIVTGYLDNSGVGATWVYTRSGGVWTQQGNKLVGTGAGGAANQGHSIAISADGTTAVVGGNLDNSSLGATWVFVNFTLDIGSIAGPLYVGSQLTVPYIAGGTGFSPGNLLTVQLSDANGSFATPVTIGTTASTTGSVPCTIPVNTPAGTGYRIRMIASDPSFTSRDNGSNLTVVIPANALDFDGTDDNVTINNTTGNFGTGDFTVEAWFRTAAGASNGNMSLLSKRQVCGNDNFFNVNMTNAGQLQFELDQDNSATNYVGLITTGSYNDGNWHHVACTRQGTAAKIYVDGALTLAGTTAGVTNISNSAMLMLGQSPCGYFKGSMDEVRIWSRALCQAEIQNNMAGSLALPQAGLVAYYSMNEGAPGGDNTGNTAVVDASGNALTGTMNTFTRNGNNGNFVAGTVAMAAAPAFIAPTATASSTTTQTVSGSTELMVYCSDIANITPSGGSPVGGSVTAKVTIDPTVQTTANGHAYVQRHYDIEPATNAANATATITLYFLQSEFNAYNSNNGSDPDLPTTTSNSDPNISNLQISQYHGMGTAPGNYTGAGVLVTPLSVVYQNNRWEVTIPVTGFSGFFASGSLGAPLPVQLQSFTAAAEARRNRVDWKMGVETSGTTFAVTRSANGSSFETLDHIDGTGAGNYTYYDEQPLSGINYYRLDITTPGSAVTYSNIAIVRRVATGGTITVAPVPASTSIVITNTDAGLNGSIATIVDMQGREVFRFTIGTKQEVSISSWAAGVYMLRLPTGEVVRVVKE